MRTVIRVSYWLPGERDPREDEVRCDGMDVTRSGYLHLYHFDPLDTREKLVFKIYAPGMWHNAEVIG